ncbi:hypothetical protein NKI48_35105 [Mesorhizobium sp. M0644]
MGLSGAQSQDREGFQHLVTEMAMGHAGIVLGLEVSRLARNMPTGTVSLSWPPWRVRSSWTRMASTIRPISTIACCSG